MNIRITTGAEKFVEHTQLEHFQGNLKDLSEENYQKLKKEILELGFTEPISVWDQGGRLKVLNGHQRLRTVKRMVDEGIGCPPLPVNLVQAASEKEAKKKVLALTSQYGQMTKDGLKEFMDDADLDLLEVQDSFRFPEIDWKEFDDVSAADDEDRAGNMSKKFLVPPFTILDSRQGYWQERKRAWLAKGLDSGQGRKDMLLTGGKNSLMADINEGTSIFDPVLCELAYSWFCPVGGTILDPFAGGSVRGIVAGQLGRQYIGVDLRDEQVNENRAQAENILGPNKPGTVMPIWIVGDSTKIADGDRLKNVHADLVFSCPPYADLEKYSDDPLDLSNMPFEAFVTAYNQAINAACSFLKPNRFACWVISDVRDKKTGVYRNLVSETIAAFKAAGLELYNEAILVNAVGTLALRAGRAMSSSRKLGKQHQNVLVFVKGNWKEAVAGCGKIQIALPEGVEEEAEPYGELMA